MKRTKKALASLAIASMAITSVPFNAFAAGTVPTRLSGMTAEQTAVAIADQTGYTGTAILASSASYGASDALTAGPLAAYLKAPILLQGPGAALNADTKAELTKLNVKKVYVTSGTAVISQAVINELKAMSIEVESLGGNDRFDTSVNIAKKLVELGAPVKKVAVAYGWLNQDALSIASIASADNQPIILTEKTGLSASAKAFLAANLGITSSDVIGGTGVIDASVLAQLPNPTRHYGNTAYDTNNQVIQDFASSLKFDNVFVANGKTGIDALAGAPLAAMTKSAIVLTDGVSVPAAAAFTYSKSTATSVVTALGGAAVVPESVRTGVAEGKISTSGEKLEIVSVSALDETNKYLTVEFSSPVGSVEASAIAIQDVKKGDKFGVRAVTLSSDRKVATLELYENTEEDFVLEENVEYSVTITVDGQVVKGTFYDSAFMEGRVIDINVADKEFTIADDDDGNDPTIKVVGDVKFDYQAAMGQLVRIWYNDDMELVNSKIVEASAKVDAIEINDDSDEITLLGEDKDYDVSTDDYDNADKGDDPKFKFYLDGEDKTDEFNDGDYAGDKYNFAKVGFDKSGDVEFVSAYALRDFLIVDSVDGDEVVGVEGDSSASFDAEDATIIKDGKVIALADIEKGDLLFFNEDADKEDGYAEVLNNKVVTGEIDEVYADAIEVDGEVYDFDYDTEVANDFDYEYQAVYIDEGGEVADVDTDAAEELQAAGEVALYTDYAGNLIYISGDVTDVDDNAKVAVLTDDIVGYKTSKDKIEMEALTEEEEELSFDINVDSLDTITVDGEEYDIDNDASDDWTESLVGTADNYTGIKLVDNTGAKADVNISFSAEAASGRLVKLHLDDDGNLEELEFFKGSGDEGFSTFTVANSLEAGDSYLRGYKLNSDTLMFDATEDAAATDADDYVVTTFGEYKGSEITNGNFIYNDDAEVEAIWYSTTDSSDNVYEEAVVTKVLRNSDDEVVSLTVYADGKEQTFAVDEVVGFEKSSDLAKGDVVVLEFDEDNEELVKDIATAAKDITNDGTKEFAKRVVTGLSIPKDGVDVGNKKVTDANGNSYKLANAGLVLDGKDNNDITEESLTDLREETNVTVVLDAKTGTFAKFFIMEPAGTATVDTTAITTAITAANAADTGVVISVDGTDVAVGTKWVTQAVATALDTAIATANTAKGTVKTAQEVTAAAAALDTAVVTYNAAKKDGTKVDAPVSSAVVTVKLGAITSFKQVTVKSTTVANAAKFSVNGATSVAIGGTSTIMTNEKTVELKILDANGTVLSTANVNVEADNDALTVSF